MRGQSASSYACQLWRGFSRTLSSAAGPTSGKPVVVFGATGSIGSALSERLAHHSYPVVLVSNDRDRLQHMQQAIKGRADTVVIPADAKDPEQVEHVFKQVGDRFGGVYGVTNLVGDVVSKSLVATDLSEFNEVIRINLHTSFNIVKSAVKSLINTGGGPIVLVSAAVAEHGLPHFEAMSAAKAGVEGLARGAAATYAHRGVRINCVAPGLTVSQQTKNLLQGEGVRQLSKDMHPVKRVADPKEIASAIEFFLHPENSFVTGQVLAVDGGLSSLHPDSHQTTNAAV